MNLCVSLRYLAALEGHRHFGRPSLACQFTQPAWSNNLAALEVSFRDLIVTRGRNFAGFTAPG